MNVVFYSYIVSETQLLKLHKMMNSKQFLEAMAIVSQNHTTEIIINKTKNGFVDTNENNIRLHIKTCVPKVIDNLRKAGFMLSMNDGLMTVDKIGND